MRYHLFFIMMVHTVIFIWRMKILYISKKVIR